MTPRGAGLRTAWERVRRRAIDHRRDELGEPWMLAVPDPSGAPVRAEAAPPVRPPVPAPPVAVPRVPVPTAPVPPAPVPRVPVPTAPVPPAADRDEALVRALHRVADSFERVAESLDADRRERRGSLGELDALVRELVAGLRPPGATAPVVVGGSIEPGALEGHIDLSRPEIEARHRAGS